MGVFDKIKNMFFEEEYVEVEEEEKPKIKIAKKIELPENKPEIKKEEPIKFEEKDEEDETEEDEKESDEFVSDRNLNEKNDIGFKFPMDFEDDDFKEEKEEEPVKEEPVEPIRRPYEGEKIYTPYASREDKKEKPVFRPTPIISPIYGILDKNYKKEEIVTKKEVHLTTAINRKMDLDAVREKAYGDLATEITDSMNEEVEPSAKIEVPQEEPKANDGLYDLNDSDHPAVEKVTMGDAEEYFNDLGLEYNVDYKDNSKEKATGRRTTKTKKIIDDDEQDEAKDDSLLENNLFDLIDSMYDDKEE